MIFTHDGQEGGVDDDSGALAIAPRASASLIQAAHAVAPIASHRRVVQDGRGLAFIGGLPPIIV